MKHKRQTTYEIDGVRYDGTKQVVNALGVDRRTLMNRCDVTTYPTWKRFAPDGKLYEKKYKVQKGKVNPASCVACRVEMTNVHVKRHASTTCPGRPLNEEETKIHEYIKSKQKGEIEVRLTIDDVKTLLDEAGITIDDVGRLSHQYALGRIGDTGIYEVGNCRFITTADNLKEMHENHAVKQIKHTEELFKCSIL